MNKIITIGGEHHNGLGLARIFGLNNYEVHSLVVSEKKSNFLSKSKFVKFSKIFVSEKEAFDYIIENYSEEIEKPFVIPYSDGAALELDNRLDIFKEHFFVPSISDKQGMIVHLMNKENQYKFAKENNIKMAQTEILNLSESLNLEKMNLKFPCILKPIISAEGDKKDITICNNNEELNLAIEMLKLKKYKNILLQEYLTVDYEIDVFGSICKNSNFISLIPTRTIRAYPPKGGTNSFSQIITDKDIIRKCETIIKTLQKIGFNGLYDIELFVVGNNVLLNEINFRNSGDDYMALSQGFYYPIFWVDDILSTICRDKDECTIQKSNNPLRADFCMTEFADLRNVLKKKCSLKQWISDYKKTSDFAVKFKGDMKPYYSRLFYYIKHFLKGKKDF